MNSITSPVNLQTCTRCLFDSSIPTVRFDEQGICNYCHSHDRLLALYPNRSENNPALQDLVTRIQNEGKGKDYDCIVGVSGGTDSSYTLYFAKKLGLRPLAVHFDNGWNTDQAVSNINRLTTKLGVDLHTYVVDWEEFKDLQISFLKASVPCIECPSDVGIHGALMQAAAQFKVKYILGGQSFITEGTVPPEWSYLDGVYISSIQKQFGNTKLKSFPNLSLWNVFQYTFLRGIRQVPVLNYLQYDKASAKKLLAQEFGWQDYGGHHYENIYSKFAFGWYQYRKFNIDKRKVTLSGQIRSGLIRKEEALSQISATPKVDQEVVNYCLTKLGLTQKEFDSIMAAPPKYYFDYFTSASILKFFRLPMKTAVKLGYFTPVLYEKYFQTPSPTQRSIS
jgi:N-acetyl sugar amidotransferase